MDIKALQLESRFSLSPNSLGFCGKDSAPERFKRCVREGECDDVEKEIRSFIVLYPYLKTLAAISSLPVFSYQVIESYWLGNDQLNKAKDEHYDLLLDNFIVQGIPDFFVATLREKRPKKFIPSHFFQVLHVGVRQAGGAVSFDLNSINNCMIRWGETIEIKDGGKELEISLNSLKMKGGKYELYKKKEIVSINKTLVTGVKVGDVLAVHWNMVVMKLTESEAEKLEYWTDEVLDCLKLK